MTRTEAAAYAAETDAATLADLDQPAIDRWFRFIDRELGDKSPWTMEMARQYLDLLIQANRI